MTVMKKSIDNSRTFGTTTQAIAMERDVRNRIRRQIDPCTQRNFRLPVALHGNVENREKKKLLFI